MKLDLYIAVAAGAFVGMLWPVIVALIKRLTPNVPLPNPTPVRAAATHSNLMRRAFGGVGAILVWLLLCVFVAAVVAALNIVPLVTGDAADKLKQLNGWQYFFLAAEGFGLASFFEEGIRPRS